MPRCTGPQVTARGGYALRGLERLGADHLSDFSLQELLFKLDGLPFLDDGTEPKEQVDWDDYLDG